MSARVAVLFASMLLTTACGLVEKAEEKSPDDPPDPEEVKDAVVEKLDCSGVAPEETRSQIGSAIEGRDFDELVAEPAELARLVAGVAVTTDTSALLLGNVGELASQKYVATAVTNRWSDLECGASNSETCRDALSDRSSGKIATEVVCADGRPESVRTEYRDGCRLFGTQNSGVVQFHRDSSLTFEDFVVGTVRGLDGRLAVETQTGKIRQIALETGEQLTVTSDPKKSCEKNTILRELTATDRDQRVDASFDASRSSDDKTVRIQTREGPVTYSKPVDCSCPSGGSLEVRHSDPVGIGEPGAIRLDYSAGGSDSCSRATAKILTWPEGCEGEESCGKGTVEDLVGELVTASCNSWPSGSSGD